MKIDILYCGMCAKRIAKSSGRLTLFKPIYKDYLGNKSLTRKGEYTFPSTIVEWSQTLCEKCFDKLVSFRSIGDKVKEDFELMLDKARIENTSFNLLGKK